MNKEFMNKAIDHAAKAIFDSVPLSEEEEIAHVYGEMLACASRLAVRGFSYEQFAQITERAWVQVCKDENTVEYV